MSLTRYFDTRYGSVAVVETDTPEAGFIELAEGQSKLALRYILDPSGKVVDQYPDKSDAQVLAYVYEQQNKAQPAAPETEILTKLQFMDRFTMDELTAVYTAAKTVIMVEVALDKWKMAEFIDVRDPNTIAGVNGLAAAGLITAERAAVILA